VPACPNPRSLKFMPTLHDLDKPISRHTARIIPMPISRDVGITGKPVLNDPDAFSGFLNPDSSNSVKYPAHGDASTGPVIGRGSCICAPGVHPAWCESRCLSRRMRRKDCIYITGALKIGAQSEELETFVNYRSQAARICGVRRPSSKGWPSAKHVVTTHFDRPLN
jgi:hypothetical protein